jgi:hypothetical protein
VDEMNSVKRGMMAVAVAGLVMATLLFSADPVSAKTKFHFGFNFGVPVVPYYGYGYAYPYPPPVPYPPCAQIWVPGYYDPYGNWVFGYYRTECGYYGY